MRDGRINLGDNGGHGGRMIKKGRVRERKRIRN